MTGGFAGTISTLGAPTGQISTVTWLALMHFWQELARHAKLHSEEPLRHLCVTSDSWEQVPTMLLHQVPRRTQDIMVAAEGAVGVSGVSAAEQSVLEGIRFEVTSQESRCSYKVGSR